MYTLFSFAPALLRLASSLLLQVQGKNIKIDNKRIVSFNHVHPPPSEFSPDKCNSQQPAVKKTRSCDSGRHRIHVRSPGLAHMPAVLMLVMRFVTVVMQSHAVELLERIRDLVARRGEAGIQRYTLQLARAVADIDTVRLLDVAEVQSVDTAALVGDDWRLRVAEQSP
jgi:hypothetical protein